MRPSRPALGNAAFQLGIPPHAAVQGGILQAMNESLLSLQTELADLERQAAAARATLAQVNTRIGSLRTRIYHVSTRDAAEAGAEQARAAYAAKAAAAKAAAEKRELEIDRPLRAAARMAFCEADSFRGGGGFPTGEHRLTREEVEWLKTTTLSDAEVSTQLGIYPLHARIFRERGVNVNYKQDGAPVKKGPVSRLTADMVREIRHTEEPLTRVAARLRISMSHAKAIRARLSREEVVDYPEFAAAAEAPAPVQ